MTTLTHSAPTAVAGLSPVSTTPGCDCSTRMNTSLCAMRSIFAENEYLELIGGEILFRHPEVGGPNAGRSPMRSTTRWVRSGYLGLMNESSLSQEILSSCRR